MGGHREPTWRFLEPFEKDWTRALALPNDPSFVWHEECRLTRAASSDHWKRSWKTVPKELASFWSVYLEGVLFKDVAYGQWGLHLLSPQNAKKATRLNQKLQHELFESDDIVLGEFFGDLELLVLDRTGCVFIAVPLEDRRDWYRHPTGLESFLRKYLRRKGDKFWPGYG